MVSIVYLLIITASCFLLHTSRSLETESTAFYWQNSIAHVEINHVSDLYQVVIKMSERNCDSDKNVNFLGKSKDEYLSKLQLQQGPDEIVVEIEGISLQSFIPSYHGCGEYRTSFPITRQGAYHVNIFRTRSNWNGLVEDKEKYEQMTLDSIVSAWRWFKPSVQDTISDRCIFTAAGGTWVLNKQDTSMAFNHFHHLDLANATHPYILTHDNADNFLSSPVYVNVSSTAHSNKCANDVNQYHWVPHGCGWKFFTPEDAQAVLKGRSLAIVGDSHARVLGNSLLRYACNVHIDDHLKYPVYDKDKVGAKCPGFKIQYFEHQVCDNLTPKMRDFDLVLKNCGHHPASSSHWPIDQYKQSLDSLADNIKKLQFAPDQVYWFESCLVPLRQDNFVIGSKDWRTLHRIKVFNAIAEDVMTASKINIIRTFNPLMPLFDKTCDCAHYTATGSNMPTLQQIFNIFANKKLTTN